MGTNEMKEKKSFSLANTLNWVCAGLMLIALILLFVPYWHYEGKMAWDQPTIEMSSSIFNFFMDPSLNNGSLESFLGVAKGEPTVLQGEIIGTLLLLVLSIITIVAQIRNRGSHVTSVLAIPFGAVTLWAFLTSATLKLGNLWAVCLGLGIALLVLGVISTVVSVVTREK